MRLFRRGGDEVRNELADLQRTLAAVSESQQRLVREHEALQARFDDQNELLWAIAVPSWLHEAIHGARETGWIVESADRTIVFHRPEGEEHTYRVRLPLDQGDERAEQVRGELQMRVMAFATRAA